MINKLFKILICLVLAFTCLFVQPRHKVQEANAFVPLLVIAGKIIVDTAIGMGIDFLTQKAIDKFKEKTAKNLVEKKGIDLSKDIKTTKSGDRKVKVDVSGPFMASVVDEIGDYAEEVIRDDVNRRTQKTESYNTESELNMGNKDDPLNNTGVKLNFFKKNDTPEQRKYFLFFSSYFDVHIIPVAFYEYSNVKLCNIISESCSTFSVGGGKTANVSFPSKNSDYLYYDVDYSDGRIVRNDIYYPTWYDSWYLFEQQIAAMERNNTVSHYADGVVVTAGHASVLKLPDNISTVDIEKLDLPKEYKKNREFEFDIPVSVNLSPTFVDLDVGNEIEIEEVNTYLDRTDVNTVTVNNYNNTVRLTTNNNYYVSETEQTVINEKIVAVLPPSSPPPSDDGGLVVVDNPKNDLQLQVEVNGFTYCVDKESNMPVSCTGVEAPDGTLLEMVKNSYLYATDTIKAGVNGLLSLAESATALTSLFSVFFGWLPSEISVLMVGGFSMIVGFGIFRAFRR